MPHKTRSNRSRLKKTRKIGNGSIVGFGNLANREKKGGVRVNVQFPVPSQKREYIGYDQGREKFMSDLYVTLNDVEVKIVKPSPQNPQLQLFLDIDGRYYKLPYPKRVLNARLADAAGGILQGAAAAAAEAGAAAGTSAGISAGKAAGTLTAGLTGLAHGAVELGKGALGMEHKSALEVGGLAAWKGAAAAVKAGAAAAAAAAPGAATEAATKAAKEGIRGVLQQAKKTPNLEITKNMIFEGNLSKALPAKEHYYVNTDLKAQMMHKITKHKEPSISGAAAQGAQASLSRATEGLSGIIPVMPKAPQTEQILFIISYEAKVYKYFVRGQASAKYFVWYLNSPEIGIPLIIEPFVSSSFATSLPAGPADDYNWPSGPGQRLNGHQRGPLSSINRADLAEGRLAAAVAAAAAPAQALAFAPAQQQVRARSRRGAAAPANLERSAQAAMEELSLEEAARARGATGQAAAANNNNMRAAEAEHAEPELAEIAAAAATRAAQSNEPSKTLFWV